ncbi:MAG: hypothetical protein QW348_05705 [Ignisphaera sp.]
MENTQYYWVEGLYMVITIKRLIQIIAPFKDREFSLEDLISRGNISPNTAKRYVREMLRQGLIREVGYNKYVVSDKATIYMEAFDTAKKFVEERLAYIFTDEKDSPLPLKIDSIEKLYIAIKHGFIPEKDVMRHIEKGYLPKWLSETLGAKMLAQKLQQCKSVGEVIKILEEYMKLA